MDVVQWILWGALPAMAVVMLFVGVGGPRWLGVALAISVCVPLAIEDGLPPWIWQLDLMTGPPRSALWWLLLLGGALGSAFDLGALPRLVARIMEVICVISLPWLLSAPLRAGWSVVGCAAGLTSGWIFVAAVWWVVRRSAKARSGLTVPLAMAIVFGVDAWVVRAITVGADWQLPAVAAVVLVFAIVTMAWRGPFACGRGASLSMTLAHSGLLLCGRAEGELAQLPFVLAWSAPLPLALVTLPWPSRLRWLAAICGVLAVAAVGAGAIRSITMA